MSFCILFLSFWLIFFLGAALKSILISWVFSSSNEPIDDSQRISVLLPGPATSGCGRSKSMARHRYCAASSPRSSGAPSSTSSSISSLVRGPSSSPSRAAAARSRTTDSKSSSTATGKSLPVVRHRWVTSAAREPTIVTSWGTPSVRRTLTLAVKELMLGRSNRSASNAHSSSVAVSSQLKCFLPSSPSCMARENSLPGMGSTKERLSFAPRTQLCRIRRLLEWKTGWKQRTSCKSRSKNSTFIQE
mmetsp:Transcript_23371/g.37027  ORF Transcript_23371/g.37027 Transcript_23371/m.37027 type:complete len:246 (-) Transcript_23371:92-829(-)